MIFNINNNINNNTKNKQTIKTSTRKPNKIWRFELVKSLSSVAVNYTGFYEGLTVHFINTSLITFVIEALMTLKP